jgi:hypothetical protein
MNERELTSRRGRAKVTLGLSILFAVGVFLYFWFGNNPYRGSVLGVLVIVAGLWEYRRTMQDLVTAERYESKAEESRRKRRR